MRRRARRPVAGYGLAAGLASVLMAVGLGVTAPATAEDEADVLAGWTFDVWIADRVDIGGLVEERRVHLIDSDIESMDFDWTASHTYTLESQCKSSGIGGAEYSGTGAGEGYFTRSAAGYPSDWQGLPGAPSYTGLQVNYDEQFRLTGEREQCGGDPTTVDQLVWPVDEIVLLPGSQADLVAAPIGTTYEYEYFKGYTPGARKTVRVRAVKGVPSVTTELDLTGGYTFGKPKSNGKSASFHGFFDANINMLAGEPPDEVCFDLTWAAQVQGTLSSGFLLWNDEYIGDLNKTTPEEDAWVDGDNVPVKARTTEVWGAFQYCREPGQVSATGWRAAYPWDLEVRAEGLKLRLVQLRDVRIYVKKDGRYLGGVALDGAATRGRLKTGWNESKDTRIIVND